MATQNTPPVPLASVQAAVMKSAAGAAAQAPPSQAVPMHQQAIAQDLSVMAEQNKGYTQGVNIGNQEAASNRSAQQGRLAQEAAQAAQERAFALEMQRTDLQAAQARSAADQADERRRLEATGTEDKEAADLEKYAERRDSILGHARRNKTEEFYTDLSDLVADSGSYTEAIQLLESWDKQEKLGTDDLSGLRTYLNQVFRVAARGKEPNFRRLTPREQAAEAASGRTGSNTTREPERALRGAEARRLTEERPWTKYLSEQAVEARNARIAKQIRLVEEERAAQAARAAARRDRERPWERHLG